MFVAYFLDGVNKGKTITVPKVVEFVRNDEHYDLIARYENTLFYAANKKLGEIKILELAAELVKDRHINQHQQEKRQADRLTG